MSNTYTFFTNSPDDVPWKLNNKLYDFGTDRTIHDNPYFTLEWSQSDEWYRFVPKAALNGLQISFHFTLDRPARVTHDDEVIAATGTPIWINDNSTIVPGAGSRWNLGNEGYMRGHFMAQTKNFCYFYQFGNYENVSLGHQFSEALANLIP